MEQLCGRPGATGVTCCMTFSMVHPGQGRRAHSARSLLQEGTQNCRRCSAPRAPRPHFKALHASNTNRATHGSWWRPCQMWTSASTRARSGCKAVRAPCGGGPQVAPTSACICSELHAPRGGGHTARPCHHACSHAVARSVTALVSTPGGAALS